MDKLESIRVNFQKIANVEKRTKKPLENLKQIAKKSLLEALKITQPSKNEILQQVNIRRETLGLPKIERIETSISFKDGLSTAGDGLAKSRISKIHSLADIKNLEDKFEELLAEDFVTKHAGALQKVTSLASDPLVDKAASHKQMLDVALALFDDQHCPVCETEWEPEEFKRIIQSKLSHLETIKQQAIELEKAISPVATMIETLNTHLTTVAKFGPLLSKPIDVESLINYKNALSSICIKLRKLFPLSDSHSLLEESFAPPAEIRILIKNLKTAIEELPDPSKEDAAREYLIIAQERREAYCSALTQLKACQSKINVANKVLEVYGQVITKELENVYLSVEKSFCNLYRIINAEDESAFEAKLTPSMGRLSFDVDFYGRGFFPPGAFHSEGHQDSMGLCLYIALMQHLLSRNFTFAVLDDVLMSVDTGHRREVCTLLKQKFPDTQFILTTHDDIWLRHMRTAGLIKRNGFVHFRTWSVDVGPTEWDDRDVWQEIDDHLAQDNVRDGASLLRHYLEYLSKEICHRLRAQVVFRGDAQYSLGDLLPSGVKRLKEFLKDGIKAAESWNQNNEKEAIEIFLKSLDDAAKNSEVEQWQINTAIHYNEWANLNKKDFEPVVDAFKKLNSIFECKTCEELLYISSERGKKEAVRCGCGSINVNLIKKS